MDSVASKLASVNDTFLNCSSSAFAMFSLRSLYFVMESLTQMFQMLRYGIAAILVLIGLKLIFSGWLAMSNSVCFAVILGICVASVASSYWMPRFRENCEHFDLGPSGQDEEVGEREFFERDSEEQLRAQRQSQLLSQRHTAVRAQEPAPQPAEPSEGKRQQINRRQLLGTPGAGPVEGGLNLADDQMVAVAAPLQHAELASTVVAAAVVQAGEGEAAMPALSPAPSPALVQMPLSGSTPAFAPALLEPAADGGDSPVKPRGGTSLQKPSNLESEPAPAEGVAY